MICEKTIKIAMGVSMVLCAGASFAATSESFEGSTLGSNVWYGDGGSFSNETVAVGAVGNVGFPIANVTHDTVYFVEGTVVCSNGTASADSSTSDFLVNISECSDELETEGLAGAKIALAAGTTNDQTSAELAAGLIPLCIYCKRPDADEASWNKIGAVTNGGWARITLAFENSRCRVSLNGEPVKNDNFGWTASTGGSSGGAWYNLASTPGSLKIASLEFIGCAKLDDVVINDSFTEITFPENAVATLDNETTGGETVSYNALNEWGMTSTEVASNWGNVLNEKSGMTVAEKIECGLNPKSDTKFEPKEIVAKSANVATVKFPCEDPSKSNRYSVVAEGATATLGSVSVVNGEATADITFSNVSSKVITFWLKAEKPAGE